MSCIYWHTRDGADVKVSGRERAWMGCLTNDLALAALGMLWESERWAKPILPRGHYLLGMSGPDFDRSFATYLKVADAPLRLGDRELQPWLLMINTALALGNLPIQLMARLHAQCEIHCFIDDKDKPWIANIIEYGQLRGVMRPDMGWGSVTELLLNGKPGPIVCSYSVCDQFPSFDLLPDDHVLKTRDDDDRYDEFCELPRDESWDLCMSTLSKRADLRLAKKGWDDVYFGDGTTMFNLRERAEKFAADAAAA